MFFAWIQYNTILLWGVMVLGPATRVGRTSTDGKYIINGPGVHY